MIRSLCLFILFFSFLFTGYSQSYNYSTSSGNLGTTYSWIDCSSGTEIVDTDWLQNVGLGDKKDDGYTVISWPFNFQFYDSYYFAGEKMYFCTNGFIRFDGVPDDDATHTYNNDISGYSPNLGEIVSFAMEDTGLEDNNSTVHYLTTGSAPNRVFTIEVQELEIRFDQEKYLDVEISFYETSNKVVIKVGSFDVPSSYSTYLGIHSGNSSYKNQWGELQSIGENKWREYTPPAKAYSAMAITQASAEDVYPSDNNKLVKIEFNISGGGGAFDLTQLMVRSKNDDDADVSNVKIFHTSDNAFSTEHQVGSTVSSLTGSDYVFSTTYNMPGGTSYIWVAYSVSSSATSGNDIGARIRANSITLDGSTYPGSNSSIFNRTISFFEWDGSTSTDWTVASNWTNNTVPSSTDNVIIPSAPANQPHLPTDNNGYCNDLTIESGATVTVENTNRNLRIYGNINNDGTLAVTGTYNILLYGTNNTIGGAGNFTTARFRLRGSGVKYVLRHDLSVYRFRLDDNCELDVNEYDLVCSNVYQQTGASSITTVTTGSISAGNTVTLDGTFNAGTGTFFYNNADGKSIINKTYYNLKVKVSSSRTLTNVSTNCNSLEIIGSGTASLAANINIDNNYTIESGCTLDMNGYSITLSGDWTNNGTLTPGSQTVTFDGIGSSHMYGSSNFYNLTINKSTGDLYSHGTNHISNTLGLTNGVVYSSNSTSIIIDAGANYTGGTGTSSFVDGPMRKDGGTNFKFPIGDFRKFEPCEVLNLSASTQFVAEYTKAGHPNNTTFNSPLTKVSLNEYWNITPAAAITADVRLYWGSGSWSGVGNLGDLRMAHYNGASWDELSGATTSGSTSSGNITKLGVNSFSPFTFGTIDNTTNPLPVSLVDFTVEKIDDKAIINWKTATEINNDYFIVQRSTDGVVIEDIARIEGGGNSNIMLNYSIIDENPPKTTVYYRLKQVDFDGKSEIFYWRSVKFDAEDIISIYPNPNANGIINFSLNDNNSISKLIIYSVDGKIVMKADLNFISGQASLKHNLKKGYYFLKIINNDKPILQKLIVK